MNNHDFTFTSAPQESQATSTSHGSGDSTPQYLGSFVDLDGATFSFVGGNLIPLDKHPAKVAAVPANVHPTAHDAAKQQAPSSDVAAPADSEKRNGSTKDDDEGEPPTAPAPTPNPNPQSLGPIAVQASLPPASMDAGAEVLPPEPFMYASSLDPEDSYRVLKLELPEPQMDRQFILAVAMGGEPDGSNRVASHHAALFRGVHGLKIRALEDQERARKQRVISRKSEAADLTRQLRKTDRYHDTEAPQGSRPWNWHSKLEVAALAGCSVLCLFIGVANITNLLQSSGEAAFSSVWKALPFALGVVMGAIALKAFARLFPDGPLRKAYGFALFGVGLLAFGWWLVGFSAIFSPALTPVGEMIDNLTATTDVAAHSGIHPSDWVMFAACLADAVLSAGAWIVAQMICQSHHTPRRTESQAWTRVRTDLNSVLQRLAEEESFLGLVRGVLESEHALQAVFVNKATALHAAAYASQRQTRELLALR